MVRLYRLLNILSLDIVAGAVICALFFAKVFKIHILPYGLAALALTVWIIYTADHLLDARKIAGRAASYRHQFHQRYFKRLFFFLCVATTINTTLLFFMRKPVLLYGLMLAFVVAIYLLIQRYLKVLKELFIAGLYTCGVLLPSLPVTNIELRSFHAALILQFVLTALINLWIFSWFDRDKDITDQQHSFATIFGKEFTTVCIYIVSFINIAISAYFLFEGYGDREAIISLLLMNLLLMAVFTAATTRHDAYRLLGDAVFFVPVFYLV